MRRGSNLRTTLAVLLMVPIAACGQQKADEVAVKAASGPRLVVGLSDATDWQSVSAQVTTQDQAQVLARIPGILTSLSVRAGDSVRRGQVIGRITDTQLSYQAGAYGAQAAAAGAQAAQAHAELERVKYLTANGVYAKARLEQAEAGAIAATGQNANTLLCHKLSSAASALRHTVSPRLLLLSTSIAAGSRKCHHDRR